MSDLLRTDAALEAPLTSREQLIAFFEEGAKSPEEWRVGTETEKIAVDRSTGRAVPFFGRRGIEEILRRLADRYGWVPREEGGHVVALRGERATITLEPGGQLELSGELCKDVHCARAELAEHVRQIVTVGDELDVVFLGLGMQPLSAVDEIPWVPKRRYDIMARYMPKVGRLGHAMMKQTATVQANFDYADGRDAMDKIRVSTGIAPIVTALFANSSVSEGRLNGYMSYRQHIWTDTDPDRCGMLPFVFADDAGFEDYTDWALDVPMYFLLRDDRLHDVTGLPFREFFEKGWNGHRATLADWNLHLTTLFPEVRLKTYIEVRSADCQPPGRILAVPALYKGILYESDCRLAAWDLVKRWNWSERLDAYHHSHREALEARVRRIPLLDLGRELVAIAREGLVRQERRNAAGQDETIYLRGLEAQLETRRSPAREIARRWEGPWNGNVRRLVEYSAFRPEETL